MQFRQGDVLVERVGDKTASQHDEKAPTLAEGEVSGHFHRVFGNMVHNFIDTEEQKKFASQNGLNPYSSTLEIGGGGAVVKHVTRDLSNTGEHDDIEIPEGTYHVINQREYDPEAERRAMD